MPNDLIMYEDLIHNKLQTIRYKFNYLLSIVNNANNSVNAGNADNADNTDTINDDIKDMELDILNLELDNIDFILNNFINDLGGNYPNQKYKELEENYLDNMKTNIQKLYLDKQRDKKDSANTIINSTLPILFQIMMITDKDSIYNSLTFNKNKDIDL